jgi:uncharacterized protein YlxW (UPF0749 family)
MATTDPAAAAATCAAAAPKSTILLEILYALLRLESQMSALSDQIAAVQKSADAATVAMTGAITRAIAEASGSQATIATLNAEIVTLKAAVDAGGATPEVVAALAALQKTVDALTINAAGIDPTSPVVIPAPAPVAPGT